MNKPEPKGIIGRVLSADSHMAESPTLWAHRVPKEHRAHLKQPTRAKAFLPARYYKPFGVTYSSDLPGCGNAEQRVQDQEKDGVEAEVLYPGSGISASSALSDRNAHKSIVRAYNDWLQMEFCAKAPRRLLGVGVIPETNIDDALGELEHCKQLGCVAVLLKAFPSNLDYPTLEDDQFWSRALHLDMPVTIHNCLRNAGTDRPGGALKYDQLGSYFKYPNADATVLKRLGADDFFAQVAKYARAGGINAIQMILHGLFERFPSLRIYIAESHVGWIPFFLEMADIRYNRHISWAQELLGMSRLPHLPSYYLKRNFLWGWLAGDHAGIRLMESVGWENVMWCQDFPHQESEWPESRAALVGALDQCSQEQMDQILYTNAAHFFRLLEPSRNAKTDEPTSAKTACRQTSE